MPNPAPDLFASPNGDIAPEAANGHPGWRIARLEMLNWGTFHRQVHIITPSGGWSLLVGENGSGKSTAVDALRTLLVPPRLVKDSYNDASGVTKGKDRSRRSYILGAWSSASRDDSMTGVTEYLRNEKDISTLLAVFQNDRRGKTVTLAQILWINGDDIGETFLVSANARSIKQDLSDLGEVSPREMRTKLEKRGFEVFKSFSGYAGRFMGMIGIPGDGALEIFNRAIGVKDVADVNTFIRRHMLEPPTGMEYYRQTLRPHFDELMGCWRSMKRAEKQLEALTPIAQSYADIVGAEQEKTRLESLQTAVPFYFGHRHLALRIEQETTIVSEIGRIGYDRAALERQKEQHGENRAEIVQALADNDVNKRLNDIDRDITDANEKRDAKQRDFNQFSAFLSGLGITAAVSTPAEFALVTSQLATEQAEAERQQSTLMADNLQIGIKLETLKTLIPALGADLKAARDHRVSIPSELLSIRERLCEDHQLSTADLPFAGELIEVRQDHASWAGALNRLLHSFGISLLVSPVHYKAVSNWIDAHHLGLRFNYLLVAERSIQPGSSAPAANRAVARLNFRPGHTLSTWVAGEVARRFPHVCVEDFEQFKREGFALTRKGQIKDGNRHTKDDRHAIDNVRNWVLGWSAEAKILALTTEIEARMKEQTELKGQQGDLEGKQKKVLQRMQAIAGALTIDRFERIDYATEVSKLETLLAEKRRLEASANAVKEMRDRIKEIDGLIKDLEKQISALDKQVGSLEDQLKTCQEAQNKLKQTLATKPDFSPEPVAEGLGEFEPAGGLKLENVEETITDANTKLQRRISTQLGTITRETNKMLPAMQDFLRDYSEETSHLLATIDFAADFVRMRDTLEKEKLREYREQFRKFLDENLLSSLANFRALLDEHETETRRRIATVNEALRRIAYTPTTYVQIKDSRANNQEVALFRSRLAECFSGGTNPNEEVRDAILERIQALMSDFEEKEEWAKRVTDVRNWLEFAISERDSETGKEVMFLTQSSGRSGGQKAKLAFTILASAIASQYGLADTADKLDTFRLVVIDEAFSRTDEENSRQALELFRSLGMQLLVVSPFDARARLVEDYVDSFHLTTNPDRKSSRITRASREEYETARSAAENDADR